MKTVHKQSVGIDCAMDDFVVSYGRQFNNDERQVNHTATFKNTNKGFAKFLKWVEKYTTKEAPLIFVMEATGVYHEKLAEFLYDRGKKVAVVMPTRASYFRKTETIKTDNDKEASKALSQMGLEKNLELWTKPNPVYRQLRNLTRERERIDKDLTMVKNNLHAQNHGAWPNPATVKRLEKQEKFLTRQKKEVEADIEKFIGDNPELKRKLAFPCSIPGVGEITAATIVAETDGFNQIRNRRQLESYAGYDIVKKESGTSVRGVAHISKRGNRHIRRAMYMPSLTAVRCNMKYRHLFHRIVSKSSVKMKGYVAVQRKLLLLMYALWKKQEVYQESLAVSSMPNEEKHTKCAEAKVTIASKGDKNIRKKRRAFSFNRKSPSRAGSKPQ